MKSAQIFSLAADLLAALGSFEARRAFAVNGCVMFPRNCAGGARYATGNRGSFGGEVLASQQAIEAAKNGQHVPDGPVVTTESDRRGTRFRSVAMEKRVGWGAAHPLEIRSGDCKFREIGPDRTAKLSEDGIRCMDLRHTQAKSDIIFNRDRMRACL